MIQVISTVQRHGQAQVQWSLLLDQAFHLEDVVKSQSGSVRHFVHSFPSAHHRGWIHRFIYTPTVGEFSQYQNWYMNIYIYFYFLLTFYIFVFHLCMCLSFSEWYWECVIRQSFYKLLAVLLCLLSAAVVWSECTFFSTHPVLSLFAVFIQMAEKQHNYIFIEVSVCIMKGIDTHTQILQFYLNVYSIIENLFCVIENIHSQHTILNVHVMH